MYGKRAQKRADSLNLGLPFVTGILNDIHGVGENGLIHIVHYVLLVLVALGLILKSLFQVCWMLFYEFPA